MARIASRKSGSRKMMKKAGPRRARKTCVSRKAKAMHKRARGPRGHQLALARAQKACSK